jgi:DNA polymerase-1
VGKIWCDAPIDLDLKAMNARDLDVAKLATLLKKLEFTSLLRRLPKHMQETAQGSLFDIAKESSIKPLEEVAWPKTLSLDANAEVIIHVEEDMVWLSTDKKTVAIAPLADIDASIWRAIEMTQVVAYDVKKMYHTAHNEGVEVRFDQVHDIAQAAFLLDPLMRERSISALAREELDMTNAGQVMAALWQIHTEQLEGFAKEPKIAFVARELDFPLTYMLYRMESRGIKIDKKLFVSMSKELGDEHKTLEQEMFTMVGYEFNIGSPAQLSEVLFTKLQLPTAGIKKGKTGYSTGQKELDKLRGLHPIIELIERTRELAKLKNTYVDTLPDMADEHDRIHTDFRQDVAATGRLSSNNPNLQNIPVRTDLGRKIREAFIPEGDKVFVSADYSQFELRLAAVLAGDTNLINDFNGDADIHTKTAAQAYGIPLDQVTKTQRRAAKVINFGVLYGMSPHGLSAATGMSFTEAKTFIDQYFELRAPIRAFIDATLAKAENEGYVETYFGRRRPTPDVRSTNFMVREGAKRAAANMPIQGTEADLMKMAMLKVDEKIGDLGEQILQVHDSILVECPPENAEKVAELLKTTMEQIYPALEVRLKVDVGVGKNWGEL